MISPHTAPGTRVTILGGIQSVRERRFLGFNWRSWVGRVDKHFGDRSYTLVEISKSDLIKCGYYAKLSGLPYGVSLEALRIVDLPDSITSALTSQPLVIEETV